jgi:DNA gyrase inhibitor GyrI
MSTEVPRLHHQPRVEERPPRPYVGIEARAATEAEFRAAVDRAMPAVFGWVAARGLAPAGAPFLRYLVVDESAIPADGPPPSTFEACVPLAEAVEAEGEVRAGELAGGRWVVALHRGGYDGLGALHRIVREWAAEESLVVVRRPVEDGTAFGGSAEHFRVGPVEEPDPWRWETDVEYLLGG